MPIRAIPIWLLLPVFLTGCQLGWDPPPKKPAPQENHEVDIEWWSHAELQKGKELKEVDDSGAVTVTTTRSDLSFKVNEVATWAEIRLRNSAAAKNLVDEGWELKRSRATAKARGPLPWDDEN